MNKKRFQRVVSPFAILSLLTFLSCGHQENVHDDGLFSDIQASGESSDADRAVEPDFTSEPTDPNDRDNSASVAELENSLSEPQPTEAKNEVEIPPMDDAASQPSLVASNEQPAASENSQPELMSTEPQAPVAETTEAAATTETAPAREPAAATSGKSSKLPKVSSETVWKKGHTLNRFYFLRSGDTPMSVSEIIYGDTSHGNDLAEWNNGTWAAGRVIYYMSAEKPGDTEMVSFYQERSISSDLYQVQKGDFLSKIAAEKYGNPGSWKEIAILNNLESPDKLEVGKSISLYPATFPVRDKKPDMVASVDKKASLDQELAAVDAQAKKEEVVAAAPVAPKPVAKSFARVERPEVETANPDLSSFVEQHFGTLLIAMGLVLLGYIFLRKMRSPSDHLE